MSRIEDENVTRIGPSTAAGGPQLRLARVGYRGDARLYANRRGTRDTEARPGPPPLAPVPAAAPDAARDWRLASGLAAAVVLPPLAVATLHLTTPVALVSTTLAQAVSTLAVLAWWWHDLGQRPAAAQDPDGGTAEARLDEAEAALFEQRERMHELRATVNGIGLAQRMLHDRPDLPAEARARLTHLRESELGRLERLAAEGSPGQPSSVDVTAVAEPLVEALRLRGHPVRWPDGRWFVLGRDDDVAEVIHILLENVARHAPGSPAEVAVTATPERVLLRLSDAGPGVPPDLVGRLFERGARGSGSPGEGVGLHVARRLARAMGGDLGLDHTSPGAGASFVLTLPRVLTPTG